MAGPIQLYFDVWPAATPASGSALGELTQARDKKIQKVLSDVGLGQFTINRHDSQAAWCESGNLVRVRLVGGGPFAWNSANYKFAFYIEDLTDEIVSPDEEAGDDWTRGGRGILSVLERLVWWSSNFMGAVGTRTDGKWHWYNDQFGDIFHRAILEWNARPAPKPIPATLGLDFSSSVDSEGTSWPSFAGAHEIDITQDYLAAAFDLCSQGLEIGMKPDYTTQAWVQAGKGTDKSATVAFRLGWNIRHAGSRVGFGPKRATRALVRGSNNTFVEVTDALTAGDEAGKWGRREVGITYQKSADTAPLTRAGQQALRSLRIAEAGPPQFGVTSYGSGTDGGSPPAKQDVLPFTDYDEGDIVTFDVPGEYANVAKRIHAITIEDGENGEGEVTLTLEGAPFDSSAGGSPTEAPGGGAAGCDCPPNPPFAPPCGPETPGSIIAEWHFTSGPYDDSGLYHSGLLVGGPTYCPGATLCGYNTASHRASSALPVTAGNSYVVTGLISWRFDPTNRPLHIEFYASNGSLISRLEVIAGVGHATGTTYTFSATVLAPTGATTARLWHSPYMGSFVDDVVFGTAGASSNDPYCVAVPGSSPYAARSDEVGTGTTTVLAERGAPMLNSSGVALTRGTVVVIDPLNAIAVTTTTAVGQTARGVGVLLEDIAVAEFGRVAFEGVVEELLVGSAAAIGDHLTTSATAGKAAVAAARGVGTFGEVLAKEVVQQPILVAFGAASGVSVGSISSASGLTLPTGWQENDIFLLFHVTNALGDVPSGWTAVTNSPQDPPGSNVRALNVYWRRATASESVPTVTSTDGGNAYAVIAAFRGCPTTGNPWNVTSGGTEASDTSVEIPGATTTIDKCYVLAVTARGLADTVAPQYSGWTNADLSSLTEIFDAGSSAGLGTGLGIAAGVKETAGAYGTTTATLANADTDAMMTIALAATSLSSSTVVALLYGQADPPASAVSETTDGTVQAALDKLRARAWKEPVRAATTAAGTLASSFENGDVIDGVTLATGDRILLKDQAAGAENGIYVVAASGAPVRATDMDASSEVIQATVQATEGTTNADKIFRCTTNAPITLGTTALVFAELSGGGAALTVMDSGGVPSIGAVDTIKFQGGTVQDLGSGDVLISLLGATGAYGCLVTDASHTPAGGSEESISFDTLVRDDGGFYNAGTKTRLTVPQGGDGWYTIVGDIATGAATNTDDYQALLRKNGATPYIAQQRDYNATNGLNRRLNLSAVIYLVAGDYIELRIIFAAEAVSSILGMVRQGTGTALPQSYLGYNTVGASWENMTARRVYMKKITLAAPGLLTDVEAYVDAGIATDQVDSLAFALFSDVSGSPRDLLAINRGSPVELLMDSVSGAGGNTNARWFGGGFSRWLAAGDYWIAVSVMESGNAGIRLAYDGSGSDRYYDAGGDWLADAGFYTVTTGSLTYSIRASVVGQGTSITLPDQVITKPAEFTGNDEDGSSLTNWTDVTAFSTKEILASRILHLVTLGASKDHRVRKTLATTRAGAFDFRVRLTYSGSWWTTRGDTYWDVLFLTSGGAQVAGFRCSFTLIDAAAATRYLWMNLVRVGGATFPAVDANVEPKASATVTLHLQVKRDGSNNLLFFYGIGDLPMAYAPFLNGSLIPYTVASSGTVERVEIASHTPAGPSATSQTELWMDYFDDAS